MQPEERSFLFKIFIDKYWVPILIAVFGIVAFVMLFTANRVNEWQYQDSLHTSATLSLQADISTFHLWLEEYLGGDKSVDMDNAISLLEDAEKQIDVLLNGGETMYGRVFWPLKDQDLRDRAEKVKASILELHEIAILRLEKGRAAGIGSSLDQQFDKLFKDTVNELMAFESGSIAKEEKNISRNHHLLLAVFISWFFIIIVALIGVVFSQQRRRQVEKSANQYLDVAGVMLLAIDSSGVVIRINKKGCDMLGYGCDEIIGKDWFENFLPERIRQEVTVVSKKILSGDIEPVEYYENPILTKSGEERIIAWHNAILRDDRGRVTGFLSSGDDITEHKLAENALRTEKNKLEAVTDSMEAGLCLLNSDLQLIWVNSLFREWFGSNRDGSARHCEEIYKVKCSDSMCASNHARKSGNIEEREIVATRVDGERRSYRVIATPIKNSYNSVTEIVELVVDITDRKKIEEQLASSAQQLEESQNIAQLGSYVLDVSTGAWSSSNILKKVLGIDDDYERSVKAWLEIVHPEEREMMQRYFKEDILVKHQLFNKKYRIVRQSDGEVRWVHGLGRLELDSNGEAVKMVGTIQDITEHKKTEEELRKLDKLEAIGVLADGIAHDYNNVMAAVVVNIGLAQMYLDPSHESYEILKAAEKSALRGSSLSNQLRVFASGGTAAKKIVFNLSELIRGSANFTLSGSSTLLELRLSDNLWSVEADEGQIRQVIQNLVLNGSKAMPDGGKLSVCAENAVITSGGSNQLKEGRYVKVSVVDEGVGIPEDIECKVFDPYFTTRGMGNGTGTGLGLAIAHSIIKEHGGCIGFASRVGEGTTFYFYLPVCSEGAVATEEPVPHHVPLGNPRILILEDDEQVYSYLPQLFDKLGYEAIVATEGAEAIRFYKEGMTDKTPFKLVILDLVIRGGIGGREVMAELLKLDPEVAALVSSGLTEDPAMTEYEKYGFKGTLAKPYSVENLKTALHKFFSSDA